MKIRRSLWRTVKPFVDIHGWSDASYLKKKAEGIAGLAKSVFFVQKPKRTEDFQTAVARLHLSEEDIQRRQHQFLIGTIFFLIIGIALFIFACFRDRAITMFLSFIVAGIAFAEAFRNHFWFTQMKHRKLGMSVREWWQCLRGKS